MLRRNLSIHSLYYYSIVIVIIKIVVYKGQKVFSMKLTQSGGEPEQSCASQVRDKRGFELRGLRREPRIRAKAMIPLHLARISGGMVKPPLRCAMLVQEHADRRKETSQR